MATRFTEQPHKKRVTLPPLVSSALRWSTVAVFALILGFITFNGLFTLTVVSGNSMLPTYNSGDLLLSAKQTGYKTDDVIVYKPQSLDCDRCNIVHRIIDGNETTGWITQGDNNQNTDPWQPTNDEIYGKVIHHLSLGSITFFLLLPQLWLLILSIIGTLILADKGFRLFQQNKSYQENLTSSPPLAKRQCRKNIVERIF